MIRLKTEIFVKAWLQRCMSAGAFATVVRKGDTDAGVLIVKVVTGDGLAAAYIETFSDRGEIAWRPLSDNRIDEKEMDVRIKNESGFDPDLWIVEVQDRNGRSFLDGVD